MATPEKQQREQRENQLRSATTEKEQKLRSADTEAAEAEGDKEDQTKFFDTMIVKIKTDEDGNEYEVMSDHLDPGEKLKRDVEEEKAEKKDEEARKSADRSAQDRK